MIKVVALIIIILSLIEVGPLTLCYLIHFYLLLISLLCEMQNVKRVMKRPYTGLT